MNFYPPASTSAVLGLQACSTGPSLYDAGDGAQSLRHAM